MLETAIRINTKMEENWMKLLQNSSGEYFWNISSLYTERRFPLGRPGSLTVLRLVDSALLMKWRPGTSTRTLFTLLFQWNRGLHHQEYIRAKWNSRDHPIHVFIVARHMLPGDPNLGRRRGRGRPNQQTQNPSPSSVPLRRPVPIIGDTTSQMPELRQDDAPVRP